MEDSVYQMGALLIRIKMSSTKTVINQITGQSEG